MSKFKKQTELWIKIKYFCYTCSREKKLLFKKPPDVTNFASLFFSSLVMEPV